MAVVIPFLFNDKSGQLPLEQIDDNLQVLAEAINAIPAGLQGPQGLPGTPGTNGATGGIGPQGAGGTPGAAGTNSYFHVAYAETADGSVDFNQVAGTYIGTYIDATQADSLLYTRYSWRLFRGAQGASGNQGIPGTNGANGQTSYLHLKYSNDGGVTFTTNAGEDPGTWLGQYVDSLIMDSILPSAYTWARIQGPTGSQGPQGTQGIAGAAGVSSYFHVAYANSSNGVTGFNQTNGVYIGTYVDGNSVDSTNPASYTWRLFLGAQGPTGTQGIAGSPGATGQTQYLHLKYSNDGGATFTANVGEDAGTWLGQYVDFLVNDSASVGAYTWAKIQGAAGTVGPQGSAGTPGTNGVSTFFHVAYADSANGSVNFNQASGSYIGTYVDTNPTDSLFYTSYTWRLLRGATGATGTQGLPGQNGANGQTSYLHLKYSNDGGATFTGNVGEDAGAWLGQYVDFVLADSVSVSAYTWTRIQGNTGATGPGGATGTPGTPGATGPGGVSAIVTVGAIVLPADSAGAVTSYAGAATTMAVVVGGADDSSSWTYTRLDGPNILSTLVGRTLTINSLAQAQPASYVDLTATRSGYSAIVLRIGVSKALAGPAGGTGATGGTGANGATGATGPRGATQAYASIGGTAWNDAGANAAIAGQGFGANVLGDRVTLYNNPVGFVETRFWNGSAWSPIAVVIDGNLLVTGSVGASKMNVTELSSITANVGLLRTATTGQRLEISGNVIRVYDAAGVLRVKLGDLT